MKTKLPNREELRKNTLAIPMSEEEKNAVHKAAYNAGVSMSTFVRMLLNDHLKKGAD